MIPPLRSLQKAEGFSWERTTSTSKTTRDSTLRYRKHVNGRCLTPDGAKVHSSALVEAGAYIEPGVQIAAGAHIGRGVWIEPDAVIGPDAEIAPHAHIRSGAAIGRGAKIGVRTVVGAHARVAGGSLIGDDQQIGDGEQVATDRRGLRLAADRPAPSDGAAAMGARPPSRCGVSAADCRESRLNRTFRGPRGARRSIGLLSRAGAREPGAG